MDSARITGRRRPLPLHLRHALLSRWMMAVTPWCKTLHKYAAANVAHRRLIPRRPANSGPELLRRDPGTLGERFELEPDHLGIDAGPADKGAESAIRPAQHVF